MVLIGMSQYLAINTFVTCVICEQRVPSSHTTAGVAHNGEQYTFACNQHLTQRGAWITAWAQLNSQTDAVNRQQSRWGSQ